MVTSFTHWLLIAWVSLGLFVPSGPVLAWCVCPGGADVPECCLPVESSADACCPRDGQQRQDGQLDCKGCRAIDAADWLAGLTPVPDDSSCIGFVALGLAPASHRLITRAPAPRAAAGRAPPGAVEPAGLLRGIRPLRI